MKRKLWVLFATIVAAVALAFGISACSPFVQLPTQPQPLGTPVVSISDEGIASWEPVVHAVGYSYLIDDAAEVSTTARNVQLEDGQTIQVKATGDGSLYLDSAYSTPATYHKEPVPELTQLATPVVSIDEEGLATWEAVPNASGYQYKLNGGEENTLKSDTELQVQLQDKDSIQVKAVGDGETYSDSEYSEAKAYTAPVKPQIIKIETPVVTIDGDGTAHWEAVAHASAYFYKIDGEDEIRTTKTSTKLQDGQTISVKACTEEEGYEDSDYSEPVKYTAPVTPPQPTQLATPEVTINEEGLATWTEVAHASGYKYKISGGEEKTLVGAELQVQLEDKQYIEVKAVGDGETYSDSPYSAAKTYNAPAKPEPTQLATPEVTINEAGLATWTEVAHASSYKYKISGGEEKTIESGAELQVQLEDKQYIEVKAVGDGETYSDSPYSAAKTYNAPAKPEPTQLATPEVTINEDGLATWERVENATGYVCKVGGEEQEVQTELSIQLQSGDTLQVKAVSTDTEHFTESAYSDLQTYTKQPIEEKEKLLASLTFGAPYNESDKHVGDYTSKWTATRDGVTWDIENFNNNNNNEKWFFVKIGSKSADTRGTITTQTPFAEAISKVVISVDAKSLTSKFSFVKEFVLQISDTSDFSNPTTVSPTESIHVGDNEFVIAEPVANRYYRIVIDCEACGGNDNGIVAVSAVNYWGEAVPELTKLDAPTLNVDSHTGDVTWEKVAGATSYTYTIDGENETTVGKDDELKVTLKNNQTISVIAKGDGTTYADSDPATQKYVHEHAYKTENNGWENDSDEGHYKKCTYCQEETEKTGHTYENGVCTECQYAHTDHKYSEEKPGECTVCHLKHTEHTYVDRNGKCHTCFAEHMGDDHKFDQQGKNETHHWQECKVCGAKDGITAHTHNSYDSDATQHWSVCACGEKVPNTTKNHTKDHTVTEDPTNHWDVCVCGKEVPGTKAQHTHDHYDIQEKTHQSVCSCGAAFGEAASHSEQWANDANNHWKVCSVCAKELTEHTTHTYGEGEQHDHCTACGYNRTHVHEYEWTNDDTQHWEECKYCHEIKPDTVKEAHDYVNGVCSNENCRHEHGGETHKLTLHSNPTHHWNECDICHLKEGETAHSEFTWQLGTDDKEGKHQHICGVCKQVADEHDAQEGAWDHDGTDHWHKCAGADDCTLPFDAKTPHGDFAWESVDDTYHQQKCKCGYTTNKVNHGEAYQWKETEDGSQHYQHCETCGHDTEKAAHSYEEKDYIADGDTGHYRVCECGHHEETEGHNYNKETGDGICTKCDHEHTGHTYNKEAKDGKCKTCGKLHVHTETLEWTKTDDTHKQYCTECGFETVPEEAHDYTKQSGSCDVCEQPHANHIYDPETHKCECGAIDPDAPSSDFVKLTVDELGLVLNGGYTDKTNHIVTSDKEQKVKFNYEFLMYNKNGTYDGGIFIQGKAKSGDYMLLENADAFSGRIVSIVIKFRTKSNVLDSGIPKLAFKTLNGDKYEEDITISVPTDAKGLYTYTTPGNSDYRFFKLHTPDDAVYMEYIKIHFMDEGEGGKKIDEEFANIGDTLEDITEVKTVTLPTPTTHTDVKFAWSVEDNKYCTVSEDGLSLNVTELPVEEDVTFTLTLTATRCVTKTKTVTVKIIGRALDDGEWENRYTDEVQTNIEEQFSNKQLESNLTLTMPEAKNVSYKVESKNETAVTVTGSEKSFTLELNRSYKEDQEAKITVTVTYTYKEVTYEETLTFDITIVGMTRENLEDDYNTAFTQLGLTEETLTLAEGEEKTFELTDTLGGLLTLDVTLGGDNSAVTLEGKTDTSFTLKANSPIESVTLKVTLKYAGKLGSSDQATKEKTITVTVVSKTAADDAKISNAYESISETITVDRKGEKDLNPAGKNTDVTLKWSYVGEANSTYPLTEAGLLTVNRLPDEALDLNLQVEISCGKGTPKTKNVTVKLEALNVSDFLDEAIGQVQVDEKLTAAEEGELKEGSYTITLPSTAEGTYFAGITFEVNSTNNTAVQIDIDGVNVTLTVTRQEEPTPITLTIKATYKGAPKESTYSFTVPAIEKPITATLNFKDNFSSYNSGWTSSYASKTIDSFKKLGVEDVSGSVELSHVSKQGSTIDDRPVLCAKKTEQYVTIKITDDNKEIASVKFDLLQWGAKTFQDIHIEYLNGSEWKSCSTTIKTPGTIQSTAKSIPSGVKQVRLSYVASEDSNTQMGLTSATIVVQTEGSGAGGDSSLTDQEKAVAAITELKGLIDEETPLTADLLLPETTVQDVTLEWEVISGDEAATVIAEGDGWKLHITPQATDIDIELYVLASCGDAGMEEWTFNLTVSKTSQSGGSTIQTVTYTPSSSNVSGETQKEVTFTFGKGSNTQNSPTYGTETTGGHLRIYVNNTFVISVSGNNVITKVTISFNDDSSKNQATISVDNKTISASKNLDDAVWEGSKTEIDFILGGSGQRRITQIVVEYKAQ